MSASHTPEDLRRALVVAESIRTEAVAPDLYDTGSLMKAILVLADPVLAARDEATGCMTSTQCAEWLVRISNDLRAAGDVRQVMLEDDGVSPSPVTVADELWLIAHQLDPDVTMPATR